MSKPRIFVGSSVEGLNIAYAIQQNLSHDAEITVWDQGVFELSQTTIESLIAILDKCDFSIFIFSPDDIAKMRKKEYLTVRDNVIFELGLFIGKLGRQRSFIVMPDKPSFHIPTDLFGITTGKFDASRSDGSLQAATGPVCHQIRLQIKKVGLLQIITREATLEKDGSETSGNEDVKQEDWWSFYFDKKYSNALELLNNEIEATTDNEKKNTLVFWKLYMEYKVDPFNGKQAIQHKLSENPEDEFAYAAVSRIFLWEDEFDAAIKVIEEGLTKFKGSEVLIFRKCEYLGKIDKIDLAISFICETDYENNEELIIRLSELYEKLEDKKSEEAFSILRDAYLRFPSSEKITYKLARLAQELNRKALALYLLDKLSREFPSNTEYWGYLGNSCLDFALNNKAMIAYKKSGKLNEKQSWILSNIGNLLNNQGLYAEARDYFKQSLTIEPESEYNYTRLADIVKSEGEEIEKYNKFLKEGLNSIIHKSNKENSGDI